MSARFRLLIELENEAFQPEPGPELARILRALAERLAEGVPAHFDREAVALVDENGQTVGSARIVRTRQPYARRAS